MRLRAYLEIFIFGIKLKFLIAKNCLTNSKFLNKYEVSPNIKYMNQFSILKPVIIYSSLLVRLRILKNYFVWFYTS